jgi:hypothetical protein
MSGSSRNDDIGGDRPKLLEQRLWPIVPESVPCVALGIGPVTWPDRFLARMPVQIEHSRVELSALYAADHAAGLAAVVILGDDFPQVLSYHRKITASGAATAKAAMSAPM